MIFYTYAHSRESDGKVFYVGKGCGRRAWAVKGRSSAWFKTKTDHGLRVEILSFWSTECEAFEHERFLIACLRELAQPLVNQTSGGEGFAGGRHSSEWRKKLSEMNKGVSRGPMSEAAKAKLRAYLKLNPPPNWTGRKHSRESIAKRTASRKNAAYQHTEAGLTMSIDQWAAHLGMNRSSVEYRLKVGKALTAPKFQRGGK